MRLMNVWEIREERGIDTTTVQLLSEDNIGITTWQNLVFSYNFCFQISPIAAVLQCVTHAVPFPPVHLLFLSCLI